jgi:predicted dehydrogenase
MSDKPLMRVALVGYAFMGAAHSQAWRNAHRFFDLPAVPELAVLCGRNPSAAAAAAEKFGWQETATDWHEVVTRDDIDVVDVSSPGDTHRDIAIAALAAGKHVLCEKPLATGVAGTLERFIGRRPLPTQATGLSGSGGGETGEVTVDDATAFFGRTESGALATFEATRFAAGRKNAMRIELNGSAGSLAFDFERLNELQVYDGTAPAADAGFRRILATEPDHPYAGAWWPPGHGLGYEHTFVHEVADFVRDVRAGTPPAPSFADGLYVQRVLDAVERSSAASSSWTEIG